MTAILGAMRAHGRLQRPNPAFEQGSIILSWKDAADEVARLASEIAARAGHGGVVALSLDHGIGSAITLIATLEVGVPIVPLPPFFHPDQAAAAVRHAGATALVQSAHFGEGRVSLDWQALDHPRADIPAGTAVISFSSGSTGDPKGVCLSAEHLSTMADRVCDYLGRGLAGRHLPILPFGILLEQVAGLMASLIAGGTYVPLPSSDVGLGDPQHPDPLAMLSSIARQRATSLILVPEFLAALVGAMEATGQRLPDLQLVAVGGAAVPPGLLDRARGVGLPVRQGYGMTEAGSVIALEGAGTASRGAVGESIGAHSIRLAADGEIWIDGPLFLGLIGAARAPGPYATGDIGRIDGAGQLWIEGRKSSLIVTSFGRNISPEWIEALLTSQPEIAQALVRGDGDAALNALLVPSGPKADVASAVERVNFGLPGYARIESHRLVPPFTPINGLLTGNGRLRRAAIERVYPKEADLPKFFDRLVAETREEQARFAMTPQLIAGLTGQISQRDYIAYLTQAYHHVRHTVPLMLEARAFLAGRGDDTLVTALDEYIDEETGHEEWILDDIAAAGGDRAAAETSEPSPATKAMVDHAYRTIRSGNPAAFFGMVFVLEGTSVALASSGAAAVEQRLGLPKTAFRYLNSHGALDQDHMRFFEGLMNQIDRPADQQAIVQMAKDMFALFGGMFAGIELEGTRRAA
nr:AMP-binding protein [uncultured Sphingomonas sp.]